MMANYSGLSGLKFTLKKSAHLVDLARQGVVTYTSLVEAFATGIKNLDW